MSGPSTRAAKGLLIFLLLFSSTLVAIGRYSAYSSSPSNVNCPTNPTGYIGACDDLSPGKYSQKLGVDFPNFAPVKLSYPTGAILVNSTGDLLFNVTLNPLMLNPLSAQIGSKVLVSGTGFPLSDTGCTLSGTPVSAPSCTLPLHSGNITGSSSFIVASAPPGSYTVTGTGSPSGDFSSYTFTILPPSLALNPSSGPAGTTVTVTGSGFFTNDNPCTIASVVVPGSPQSCSISGNSLSYTFNVPVSVAPGSYTIAVVGNTRGDTATAQFQVTASSQSINLGSSSGLVGASVTVSGSGFLPSDTSCTLSGGIVTAPLPCSIAPPASGLFTTSFIVGNLAPGVYTVTATGNPGGDSATANFLVQPAFPTPPVSVSVFIDLYIPPDFSGVTLSQTWTSFSNNYDPNLISVSRQSSADQVGPNWWKISITNLTVTNNPGSYTFPLVRHRVFVVNRSQYIRLFQVTSPLTAGRYFFKAFITGFSIGASNFPTLIVKSSKDPAYISGTLRDDGTRNPVRAGLPIILPYGTGAQIVATGFDYLGRPASAQAFINSTAQGRYTLFGVAPGTYNITAYAAGFLPTQRPTTVSVAAAQSLESVDIYMPESVNITATVYSKSANGGLIPWGAVTGLNGNTTTLQARPITIKLLNLDGTIASSTPSPDHITTFTNPFSTSFNFSFQHEVGYDGRIPQDDANYTSGITSGDYLLRAYVTSYIQLDEVRVHVANATTSTSAIIPLIRTGFFLVTVHFKNSNATLSEDPIPVSGTLTVSAYDMQGILRAQNVAFVNAGVKSATVELDGFSNARSFGISSLFQQNYGILPGTYHIKATFSSSPSFAGYANIGIRNLYYQLADVEATIGLGQAIVEISLPLFKGGGLLLTFYSIDDQLPPLKEPWAFPGANIQIQILDSYGNVYSTNATQPQNPQNLAEGFVGNLTFFYAGLLSGDYAVVIRTLGYTQTQILHLHVILGGNSDAPIWMIQNPTIDLTLAFEDEGLLSIINSTQPYAQPINHIDATPVRLEVFDDQGNFVAANETYIPNLDITNGEPTRIAHFILAGFNKYYGDPRFVWEGFYDTTDAVRQNAGGLFLYPWSNEETRTFTVRLWVNGYYQFEQWHVIVPARDENWDGRRLVPAVISVAESVNRASRISGSVIGPDFFDRARPLSWATVTLQPDNYTLSGIIDVQPGNYTTSSLDGFFQVWVPEGNYGMGVSLNGYTSYSTQIAVPSGSDLNMYVWLDNY